MHVVDTDVCVDALRGEQGAIDELAALEREGPLGVTTITAHELWQGAYRSRDPEGAAHAVHRFLSAFDLLDYDPDAAQVGGRLAADLGLAGTPIGDLDTMIAAIALSRGGTIVTRNVRHFRRVEGLPVHAVG